MRSSTTNLIAILTIGAAVLAANSALAGCGGGGGGGGHHGHRNFHYNNFYHHKVYHHPVKKYYAPVHVYDQCYHPFYNSCFVHPGDTWYTIAKRCYGQGHLWKHIATYNHLGLNSSALVPGQQLQLPVVNANGTLAVSNAPSPAPFVPQGAQLGPQAAQFGPQSSQLGPQGAPFNPQSAQLGLQNGSIAPQNAPTGMGSPAPQQGMTSGNPAAAANVQSAETTAPAAGIRMISNEPKRPIVTIGSTLELDGESLGGEKGIVRLRISGMALPVEVLQWSDSAVKIQLPAMDLAEGMDAELEVLRADGTLASKSAVELMPAATRLALGN